MVENGDFLYIRTCHEMYESDDGLNHQANMSFSINKKSMELVDKACLVGGFAYTSHSFNQFIDIYNDKIFTLDHGDAYPRGLVFRAYPEGRDYYNDPSIIYSSHEKGRYMLYKDTGDLPATSDINNVVYKFAGETGENFTGVKVGGFEHGKENFVIAGSSIDQNKPDDRQYNIFIITTSMKSENATPNFKWLTNTNTNVSTPVMTKINDNAFLVMWTEGEEKTSTKCVIIDEKGNKISPIKDINAMLSDCKPLYNNNKVYWFVTEPNNTQYLYESKYNDFFYTLDVSNYNDIKLSVKENFSYDEKENKTIKEISDFTDTSNLDEYKTNALNEMIYLGVISGYSDNTIRPYTEVTKAEYICMLTRFLKLPVKNSAVRFNDVPDTHWAYNEISTALNEGIIDNKNGMFYPNQKITLEEAVKILFRAKGYDSDINKYPKLKYEEDLIRLYGIEYYKYMDMAYHTDFISSSQYNLLGWGDKKEQYITRAALAVMFHNTIEVKRIYIEEENGRKTLWKECIDGTGRGTEF